MKFTVLSDNRSENPSLETEHGLSILLETKDSRILLDTGASDIFARNASKLDIDLSTVDFVFLSHGHADHTGGLSAFLQLNNRARIIVSPEAIEGKFYSKRNFLHSITAEYPLEKMRGRTIVADHSQTIVPGIHVLAHIPHSHPMPRGNRNLLIKQKGEFRPDDFSHEIALYVEGLLFTGCAHSGLENILSACPWPVSFVVGGFHLLDAHLSDSYETEDELTALAQRLINRYPTTHFFTSHCTGDNAFAILKKTMGNQLHSFSCGTTFNTQSPNFQPEAVPLS